MEISMDTTREKWLQDAVEAMRPLYAEAGTPLPELVKASFGFPSRKPLKVLGQCHYTATDKIPQVYVTPRLADSAEVLSTLAHELCHAALPAEVGHKRQFSALGTRLGLVGKPTEMGAGPELLVRLNAIVSAIGPVPHSALTLANIAKVQSTRLLKCTCPECGYTVRVTRKWLDVAMPTCTVCQVEMMEQ
jgi:hypothetical protein